MTSFVNDEGEYIDYAGFDIGITKQCANFYDFKIKGDVTATLKIPNNSQNRRALGYYGANQINSPAFSRSPFNMVKDGNTISRGYVVIKDSDEENINIFYVSGNTNWFQSFQFNLKDIDFDDYLTVLGNSVNARKSATEGIIFPLIDWWGMGSRRSTEYMIYGRNYTPNEPPEFTEIHPCLYLHTIVKYAGEYGGIGIGGDLIDDPLFKKIILTPAGPDYFVPDSIIARSYVRIQNGPFGSAGAGLYDYTLDPQLVRVGTLIEGSGQVDASAYSFFAPYTGTYRIDGDFWFNNLDTYNVDMYVNGVLYSNLFNATLSVRNKIGTAFVNMRKGDRLQFYVNNTAAANYRLDYLTDNKYTNVSIKLEKIGGITPTTNIGGGSGSENAAYIIPNEIVPDMKAIDMVKFLANYFCCSVSYDEYSNSIQLNKISSFDKAEAEDWSEYFVGARYKWETKVARKNYIQVESGEEADIKAYNEQSNVAYGGGTIETSFDSLDDRDLFKVPFPGSWDVKNKSYSRAFWPYVNFYDLELAESVSYSGVTTAGGGLWSQFTSTFTDPIERGDVFYVISGSGIYTGFASFYASATATTNPQLAIPFVSNDTGTIVKYKTSKVSGPNRMLICEAGRNITDIGGTTLGTYNDDGGIAIDSGMTVGAVAWYDKPKTLTPIDSFNESLAVDSVNSGSLTISERYLNPAKRIFNNPLVEAEFILPLSVFTRFNFDGYIYLKTKDLTGHFIVQRMENYRDALTPIKVELLYAD